MIETAILFAGVAGVCAAIHFLARLYLAARGLFNSNLRLADNDFFEASNALLASSDRLPPDVIDLLQGMGEIAYEPSSERAFLHALQSTPSVVVGKGMDTSGMTEAQHDLLSQAVRAWVGTLRSKNILTGVRIWYAMAQRRAQAGRNPKNVYAEATPFVRNAVKEVRSHHLPAMAA